MTKMTRVLMIVGALAALIPFAAVGQTSPDDPAILEAKEKTAVVFDLGRIFGYLQTLESEQPKLILSAAQLQEVYAVMETIRATERIEPRLAEELLTRIEEEILTPTQLTEVDQIAIAKMNERETNSTSQSGRGGGGQITSYISGGKFNPMLDSTKNIGKDFAAYYQLVSKRLGK